MLELPPMMRPRMTIGSEEWLCLLGLLRQPENWTIEDGKLVHNTGVEVVVLEQDQIECHFDGSFLAWVPDDENAIMMEIAKLIRILDASRFEKFLVSAKMSLDEVPSEDENTSYGRERIRHAKMAAAQAKMAQMNPSASNGSRQTVSGGGGGGLIGVMANSPPRSDAGKILDRIRQKQSEASVAEAMREAYDLRKSLKENKPKKKAWWEW